MNRLFGDRKKKRGLFGRGRNKQSTTQSLGGRDDRENNQGGGGGRYVDAGRRRQRGARRGGAGKPTDLPNVVTPRADNTLPGQNDDGHESSSEDHTTEMDREEEKTSRLPGQRHFPEELLLGRYTFTRYLGHGSYGHVCEGWDVSTEKKVAIKKVDAVFDNDIDAKRLLREMRILRTLRDHQAIVDLIDLLPPSDPANFNTITLVFEFVDTDLSRLIASDQNFTTLHVQYMMYQILLGMKYMHSAGIAHRDLKPANILVNEDCTLKICDFGLSRGITENIAQPQPQSELAIRNQNQSSGGGNSRKKRRERMKNKPKREVTRHVVTRWYRAPEVILLQQRRELLKAVDVWSIGCIMAELLQMKRENGVAYQQRQPLFPGTSCFPLSARDPFAYADRMDQLNVIFDQIGTPSEEDIAKLTDEKAKKYLRQLPRRDPTPLASRFRGSPPDELAMLQQFIVFDPEQRITIEDALNHSYFQKVKDVSAERDHPEETFEFEDVAVSLEQLRALIVDEIGFYNPDWYAILNGESVAAAGGIATEG